MSVMPDNTDDALFVIDRRGRIVSWPPGAEALFGFTAAEMQAAPASAVFDLSSDELLAWLGRAGERGPAAREGPCRRRDGSSFVGATVIRRAAADAGEQERFVAVTRDVTGHRGHEDHLLHNQKLEAIGLLAGGIAHDFNNLLTVILGHADLLEAASARDDPRQAQIAGIQEAAERGARLTQRLLAFSRRQALTASVVDLSALVRNLWPILRRLAGDRIEIVDAIDPTVPSIVGDRMQLERVVVNVVTTARDAMPDGGRLTIRTASTYLDEATAGDEALPGPYVSLEVADAGTGTDEPRVRVFEPFFTTRETGRGPGLGLAAAYGLVRQMGGTIRVAVQPGAGTSVRLHFPAGEPEAAVAPIAAASPEGGGNATLLVVEDDPSVLAFLRRSLERDGFRVLAADHPASALETAAVHADSIALVITDVRMPGGSGPELVHALRAILPGVPALYISGYEATNLSPPGRSGYFLQKPFSSADLLACVRKILSPSA